MNESIEIECQDVRLKPVYGGQKIEIHYFMKHTKYGRVNRYIITCKIIGIESGQIRLNTIDAEFVGDLERCSNDETLTNSAAMELFESQL